MIASLKRINELAAKQRHRGLTDKEVTERDQLRQEYLLEIRGQMKTTIASLTVLNEAGEDITPEKVVVEKAKQYQSEFLF